MKKGACILVSEPPDTDAFPQAVFLKVDDALAALQRFAREHREQFGGKILALTGSNGKTTVKEWLHFFVGPRNKNDGKLRQL